MLRLKVVLPVRLLTMAVPVPPSQRVVHVRQPAGVWWTPAPTLVSRRPVASVYWMQPAAANARPGLFVTHSQAFVFQILTVAVAHPISNAIRLPGYAYRSVVNGSN